MVVRLTRPVHVCREHRRSALMQVGAYACIIGLCMGVPGLASGQSRAVEMTSATTKPAESDALAEAKRLYDEGRKAYRLTDYQTAVEKWERAYELSERPLLLYNLSLGYEQLFLLSKDKRADWELLVRSRLVLDNFIKVSEGDPNVDLGDAIARLEKLDQQIAEGPPPPLDPPKDEEMGGRDVQPTDVVDPGRRLRRAGIGSMIGGGVAVLLGGGLAGFFAARSREFSDSARTDTQELSSLDCDLQQIETQSLACRQLAANVDTWEANRDAARRDAFLTIGIAGGLGVAALTTGAVLYVKGDRKTQAWKRRSVEALRVGWNGSTLFVAGRF